MAHSYKYRPQHVQHQLGPMPTKRQMFCSTCELWIRGGEKELAKHKRSAAHQKKNRARLGYK